MLHFSKLILKKFKSDRSVDVGSGRCFANSPLFLMRCRMPRVIDPQEAYKRQLAEALVHGENLPGAKILAFKDKAPAAQPGQDVHLREIYANTGPRPAARKHFRSLPQAPERILDAPDLIDDYYLNLLDWSCNNEVVVALGPSVYLWSASTGEVQQLMQATTNTEDYITRCVAATCKAQSLKPF
jgi:hypothetical protein